MADLLLELFSEEIPARMQLRAASDLKRVVTDALVEAGLPYADAGAFSTPRRLCLAVAGLPDHSAPRREERRGPRVDAPEKALEGFLRSTGLAREALEQRPDKKGDVWFAVTETPGRPVADIVAEVVSATIHAFPWPKSMRWGSGSLRWVRPLHSVLCILHDEAGANAVPLGIEGVSDGDVTHGHRFMAPGPITVTSFEDYEAQLARAFVTIDPAARAEKIAHDAAQLAFAQGLEVVEDAALLAEIAGLVEWPVVLMGAIGADFLDLPVEVLQTSMAEHQKFLSVRNAKTGGITHYITVANRETADNGATILAGNGRVLAARLADAKFFWDNDLRKIQSDGLEAMGAPLASVTFHSKLGSEADRVARIGSLARRIAPQLGAEPDLAEQAARVCKADLASEMVYEFPELQGVMGRYYAQASGLDPEVSDACETHYAPLGPSDAVPTAPVSVAVSLAEKIDKLTGFWSIDEKPTGSKDPFALRRAALGVFRVVLSQDRKLNLLDLFDVHLDRLRVDLPEDKQRQNGSDVASPEHDAATQLTEYYGVDRNTVSVDLLGFLHDRLKVHLRDQGVRHDVIDACIALPGNDDLALLVKRVEAVQALIGSADGENLVQAYRRAVNILTSEEKKDGVYYEMDPEAKFADRGAETGLFEALDVARPQLDTTLGAEDFIAAAATLAGLRAPIDAFFEDVQVNTDNAIVRRNRLCLLNRIRVVMHRVADFSALEG